MKNSLMKFAGFFVEKVPIEAPVSATRPAASLPAQPPQQAPSAPAANPAPAPTMPPAPTGAQPPLMQGHFPSPSGAVAMPGARQQAVAPLSVALRAWVPQEYAGILTPFGLHVIAAGGELTVEQARAYGAQALVVSAECLGSHTHLLASPQLPTVFVTPQQVMIPERAGVVQVLEPLRASEVAAAARDAVAAWNARTQG